ncbi:hypothetical protein J2Y69_002116 [Microbacterium resistens]|uniref:C2H2-type domain-containing protein n=1 Tax=Microbacterium resistens TaxID=156977 RepID=A0ABU1SD42_9MICO|nr:hypothetical protein [Microbacterium resistens]MDR6867512.1 hypothetical protein [Microbacterium resistens]
MSADAYPLGARWMCDDSSVWEVDWDDQDKRHMWTLVSVPGESSAVPRAEVVTTGQPEVQVLACIRCGVLLWNIEAHYADAHPDRPDGSRDAV